MGNPFSFIAVSIHFSFSCFQLKLAVWFLEPGDSDRRKCIKILRVRANFGDACFIYLNYHSNSILAKTGKLL